MACALLALHSAPSQAIDNPDAPDRVAVFEAGARPLEQRVADAADSPALAAASRAYAEYLEAQLQRSYQDLLGQLDPPARQALVQAQRQWLAFRVTASAPAAPPPPLKP